MRKCSARLLCVLYGQSIKTHCLYCVGVVGYIFGVVGPNPTITLCWIRIRDLGLDGRQVGGEQKRVGFGWSIDYV